MLVRERLDFGVVLIRRGSEVGEDAAPELHRVGTMATMQRIAALPDGTYSVVARGLHRFRLLSLEPGRPYPAGRVERLSDSPAPARPSLVELLERYLAAHGVEVAALRTPELRRRAVWLVGSVLQAEPLLRQRLLETGDPQLAETLLAEQLAKVGGVRAFGPLRPRPPSPN